MEMNSVILNYVAEQERLNLEMDTLELNATIAKARMGFVSLKESLEKTTAIVMEKSGRSSEYVFEDIDEFKQLKSDEPASRMDYCKFCRKNKTKIFNHLENQHSFEAEVMNYVQFKKCDPKKYLALRLKFRGASNYEFNSQLSKNEQISKIVNKSESVNKNVTLLPCSYCHHYFVDYKLSRHMKACPVKEYSPSSAAIGSGMRCYQRVGRFKDMTFVEDEQSRKILASMKPDSITTAIREDAILMRYLRYQCKRYYDLSFVQTLKQKTRGLAAFMLHCRKMNEFRDMSDILNPLRFEELYRCIQDFAGRGSDGQVMYPSRLKKTCENLGEVAHREELWFAGLDREREESMVLFQRKLDGDAHILSRAGRETLKKRMFNKVQMFPLFQDIAALNLFLDNLIQKSVDDNSVEDYVQLATSLLAKIILFNRKRPKEIHDLRWITFQEALLANAKPVNPDIFDELDQLSKFLIRKMFRMEMLGKRSVKTAVLLTQPMLTAMKTLHRIRRRHVHESVHFIFARPGRCATPFVGGRALKVAAEKSGVADSALFRSTGLRKHLATMTQALHMTEYMQEDLAVFMQHSPDVHKRIYQLPQGEVQKYSITKCLYQMNFGKEVNLDEIVRQGVGNVEDSAVVEYSDSESEEEGNIVNKSSVFADSVNTQPFLFLFRTKNQ